MYILPFGIPKYPPGWNIPVMEKMVGQWPLTTKPNVKSHEFDSGL